MKPPPADAGRFFEHLRNVEVTNSGWVAACPTCGTPDGLGIALRPTLIVVSCRQGCGLIDVLAGLGLTLEDIQRRGAA